MATVPHIPIRKFETGLGADLTIFNSLQLVAIIFGIGFQIYKMNGIPKDIKELKNDMNGLKISLSKLEEGQRSLESGQRSLQSSVTKLESSITRLEEDPW